MVGYGYDDAVRLSQVSSGETTYANQFNYNSPEGLLTSVALGNGAVQSFSYNSRLQLKTLELTKSGTQLQHYDYKYGVYNPGTNTLDETKNNGQIAQLEGFIGAQKQWQQRLAYDSLGRLKSAREHRGDNNEQSYLLNYDYDLFGNRYQYQSQNGDNPFAQAWVESGQISQTSNRYTSGVTYDAAGNITQDTKFRNLQFQYDANNRQRRAANLDDSGAVTAVFDGAGQRLATMSNGVISSISVYDAIGKLVAEYGEGGTTNGTQYLMSDHQGSPRVVMKNSGTAADLVRSRHDYLPFGEELFAGTGGRTTGQGYVGDSVRQKFTLKERDNETGLDYFLARYYSSTQGRFTGVDPGPFTVADPQSWNRYLYVQNNPLKFIDPTGLKLELSGNKAQELIDYLKTKTGLDLKYDSKTGRVTVGKGKRVEEGTSKELAKTLKGVIGDNATAKFNVSANTTFSKGGNQVEVFVDDGENAWNDNNRTANVDIADIQSLDKQAPEFGTALVGHFLIEGLEVRKPGGNYYNTGEPGAHDRGLEVERRILSEATGTKQGGRQQKRADPTYSFIYTSVQYDVTFKSDSSFTVNKTTRASTPPKK